MTKIDRRWAPWPSFAPDEVSAVQSVLESGAVNYWTGTQGKDFEAEYADHCRVNHGVALANGTLALELALRALGIGPGDEVIVTPRSFMASASCVPICGATPVFADVDMSSQNLSPASVAEHITPRTRAIIAVHHAGWPCEMDELMAIADRHGLYVIEDCAQAHGASYKGRPVGGIGHVGVFSFCQDKIITTGGEGGMLVTNDEAVWRRAWSYKDHGKNYDAVFGRGHAPGFRWVHESFGSNWRMTEMQAAIGRIQLRKLPDWTGSRRAHAERLMAVLGQYPVIRVEQPPEYMEHAYYRLYAFVEPGALAPGWDRDRIMVEIGKRGIACFAGSCPEIYRERAFVDAGFGPDARLPNAQALGPLSLAFLVHPTLTEADLVRAGREISAVLSLAGI